MQQARQAIDIRTVCVGVLYGLFFCFHVVHTKRGLPKKFACFALFHPVKKRSLNLLCVLDLFFRTLTANSCSDFFSPVFDKKEKKKVDIFSSCEQMDLTFTLPLFWLRTVLFIDPDGNCVLYYSTFFYSYEKCECVMISVRPVSQLSVCVWQKLHYINMINVKLCMMAVLLIELYLFILLHRPWLHFNITALSNSFNRTFYVLILFSSNFIQLLMTSSRSWIYHYFWFSHIFKEHKWHIVSFGRPLILAFSLTPSESKVFQTLHDYNLVWVLHCHCSFDDLDFTGVSEI